MERGQTGVGISYEKSGAPFPVSGNSAVHIYRILQEALNNVARHSGAKKAWVRLRFAKEGLELEIEDRGSGFATARAKRGLGLIAMRERTELLGGTLKFEVPAGGGTRVRHCVFPKNRFRERHRRFMPDQISVLLVDDHSLVRRGFRRMLEDEPDIHVIGEASDGLEAVNLARSLKPQVIVMDCALPEMNNIQASAENPGVRAADTYSDVEHAYRGILGAASDGSRRSRVCSKKCAGPGIGLGNKAHCERRDCSRRATFP